MTQDVAAFLAGSKWVGAARTALAGDASARRYERLTQGDESAVLMIAPPKEAAAFDAFLTIAEWLRRRGFSAPEIFYSDQARGLMLMEDFGDGLVARMAEAGEGAVPYGVANDALVALSRLDPPDVPVLGAERLAEIAGLAFDEAPDPSGLPDRLEFQAALRAVLLNGLPPPATLSLRDFHAENLVWLPGRQGVRRVGLLDFQDAVVAPAGYDLASLVDDPRRVVNRALRSELIATHARELGQEADGFARQIDLISLARNLRILGIFRRVARLRNRPGYLDFLPRTAELVREAAGQEATQSLRAHVARILTAYGFGEGQP